jgi:hypothetical protein
LQNLFSKKAPFEEVKKEEDFVKFHADRFEHGARDDLARACFAHIQSGMKNANNTRD